MPFPFFVLVVRRVWEAGGYTKIRVRPCISVDIFVFFLFIYFFENKGRCKTWVGFNCVGA